MAALLLLVSDPTQVMVLERRLSGEECAAPAEGLGSVLRTHSGSQPSVPSSSGGPMPSSGLHEYQTVLHVHTHKQDI